MRDILMEYSCKTQAFQGRRRLSCCRFGWGGHRFWADGNVESGGVQYQLAKSAMLARPHGNWMSRRLIRTNRQHIFNEQLKLVKTLACIFSNSADVTALLGKLDTSAKTSTPIVSLQKGGRVRAPTLRQYDLGEPRLVLTSVQRRSVQSVSARLEC